MNLFLIFTGFNRKEFRGKLAIAVTANFINRHTIEEARVPEISGVAFIFNQKFFQVTICSWFTIYIMYLLKYHLYVIHFSYLFKKICREERFVELGEFIASNYDLQCFDCFHSLLRLCRFRCNSLVFYNLSMHPHSF